LCSKSITGPTSDESSGKCRGEVKLVAASSPGFTEAFKNAYDSQKGNICASYSLFTSELALLSEKLNPYSIQFFIQVFIL
jgi:hypothetical protein